MVLNEKGIKRLTTSDNRHRPYAMECFKCFNKECNRCDIDYDVWERLAEYEDAEEAGLIKRLPCKEGTPIYYIKKQCEKCRYNSLKKIEKDCEYYKPDYYGVEERCVLDIEDDEEYRHYCSQNLKIFCNLCKERLVVCKDVFTLSKINQIYGTAQYNPNTELEDTYFLTVEEVEEKIEELQNDSNNENS